jgi:hypothetical protein
MNAGRPPLNPSTNPTQILTALYHFPHSDFHNNLGGDNGTSAFSSHLLDPMHYDLVTGLGTPIANIVVPHLISVGSVSLSPSSVPASTVLVAYSQTITATGGIGNKTVTYAVTSGTIPDGLTFTPSDNQLLIAGTPTSSGIVTFNVTATDTIGDTVTRSYTLTINPAVSFSPTSVPQSTAGIAYNQTITANGGTGDKTVSYVINSGSIPPGITFTPGTNQLVITGTPTDSGIVTFSVTGTDTVGASTTQSYTLTINPAVSLSPASVPNGIAGLAYSQVITANGGTGTKTVTYTITSGSIPAGLTFTTSDNQLAITGTPYVTGTVSFDVTATDAVGASVTQSYTFSIVAAAADHLVFLQMPTTTGAGQTITPAVRVAVVDAFGNVVTSDSTDMVTLSLGVNPSGGTLSGTLTVTVINGIATFSDLAIDLAGDGYTLHASVGGSLADIDSDPFSITM